MTSAATLPLDAVPLPATALRARVRGYWGDVWQRFCRNRSAVAGLVFVVFMTFVGVFAPFLAGVKPALAYYKGNYYLPALAYYSPDWEPNIFYRDRIVLQGYSLESMRGQDPASWVIWPLFYQDPVGDLDLTEAAANLGKTDDPAWQDPPTDFRQGPSRWHWFGTTNEGVDVLAAMIHGTSIALLIGFVSTGIAAMIGIPLGALAGYFGGWVDMLVSRLIEVVMCIPSLVLIMAVIALVNNPTIWHVMAVIGGIQWTGIARLTRAEFLRLREMDYVQAARALGAGHMRVMLRHILPNSLAPILVPITFGIASAILTESGLSLLGLTGSASPARWGALLNNARQDLTMWWLVLFPGLAIFLSVLSYNLIGEGLQEATDPRLRNR
ncbi:MAG: ABC transporter permease [Pirellulales bacterium]|nr:ABC transporter permease [Pirellulales bacterium]